MNYYNIDVAIRISYRNIHADSLQEAKEIVKETFEHEHNIEVETNKMVEVKK